MAENELKGIPEEVQGWIGTVQATDASEFPIERGYILTTASATENGNPIYWDEKVAGEVTDGIIAHPTMLSVWTRPHRWSPGATEERVPLETHFRLKKVLELPEAIIARNELSFGEPVRPGDQIRSEQVLDSISPPKTLKLGTGRFWVISVNYYNQRDGWIGTESYDCFGYRRD